jgi:hypothetical protein
MGLKRDQARAGVVRPRQRDRPLEDRLMSAVNTVEVPEGQDRAAEPRVTGTRMSENVHGAV